MKATLLFAVALITTATVADPNKIVVEYANAEKFTDANDRRFKTAPEKNQNLIALKSWLEKQSSKFVPEQNALKIRFDDIDLAGDYEPWQPSNLSDVRIVKDIYPPKLKFHFQLIAADNTVVREGDKELRDIGFMMRGDTRSSESMRFEKRMLEEWLREEFAAK